MPVSHKPRNWKVKQRLRQWWIDDGRPNKHWGMQEDNKANDRKEIGLAPKPRSWFGRFSDRFWNNRTP